MQNDGDYAYPSFLRFLIEALPLAKNAAEAEAKPSQTEPLWYQRNCTTPQRRISPCLCGLINFGLSAAGSGTRPRKSATDSAESILRGS